jgi:S-methylmethionine-dependent homocysteine/selenocysteine methylase
MKNNLFNTGYYLTDGGLETTLVFHEGIELTHFAAFELLNSEDGRKVLRKYYNEYIKIAKNYHLGFVLETPTWRANSDWGYLLGYSPEDLDEINKRAVTFVKSIGDESGDTIDFVVSGNIGPRGDGYVVDKLMTVAESENYHSAQIKSFVEAGVNIVTAMTINYADEAIGIVMAAGKLNIPVVISFTVETDGKLPDGTSLKDAINKTDKATENYALHYMINCAHPDHFKDILDDGDWKLRIKGIRANASVKSHAELNESPVLDTGDKAELANGYSELKQLLPNLQVIGGCCGTDHTHMEVICENML